MKNVDYLTGNPHDSQPRSSFLCPAEQQHSQVVECAVFPLVGRGLLDLEILGNIVDGVAAVAVRVSVVSTR